MTSKMPYFMNLLQCHVNTERQTNFWQLILRFKTSFSDSIFFLCLNLALKFSIAKIFHVDSSCSVTAKDMKKKKEAHDRCTFVFCVWSAAAESML